MTKTVFDAGQLVPPFNSCNFKVKPKSDDCFTDDSYNDRLVFQLTFTISPKEIVDAFQNTPPKLTFKTDPTIAKPAMVNAVVQVENAIAEIEVRYNCQSSGAVSLKLQVIVGNDVREKVTIYWQKQCATGVNDKLTYGYLSPSATGEMQHHSFGGDSSASVIVAPADVSTEFFMKLDQPGAQQIFYAPYVTSSDTAAVKVAVRGNHPQGGVIQGLTDTSFQVGYNCASKGDAVIKATIAVPPFKNITASWRKDCGGKTPRNLQVGTSEDGYDVVDNGRPTPRYMVGIENIGTAHSEEHLHLPGNQSDWVFYIMNNDTMPGAGSPDTAMHIGHIVATVEQPSVLMPVPPEVYEEAALGWRAMERAPYALGAGAKLKVRVHMVCREKGESRVLMTVPVLGYKQLEFGLAKECEHGGLSYSSSEFVLTVGDLFWIVVGVLVFSCACFYVRRRRAKSAGFQRVSTMEH